MATIDVLLPVKNGIDFLAESLDSVLAQTWTDWRLLVLDHGSTDGSRELAQSYQARDSRVEVHSFPQAQGLAGLLNCGLDICTADFAMRHDADDVCLPERMAITLAAFAAQPDAVAIGGQCDVINGAGAPIGKMRLPVGAARVTAASFFSNPIAHPAATLRMAAVRQQGIRYGIDFLQLLPVEQRLKVDSLAEDYFLFGQLAIQGKCNNVPETLLRYRWHGNNVSALRFNDQMAASLAISRTLVRSFCVMHKLAWFDPAPFCNHGGMLFDVDGRRNFDPELRRMASALRQALGHSGALERELGFRAAIAARDGVKLLWRYFQFQRRNLAETGEWNAVRSWLLRRLPRKSYIKVASELHR